MRIVRVYDAIAESDGTRVLVDRLWPRGVRRDDPRAGVWLPEAAPSSELRRWYGHDPARLTAFAEQYRAELIEDDAGAVAKLCDLAQNGPISLVTATREPGLMHANVLAEVIDAALEGR